MVSVKTLKNGDRFLVKSGEKIPTDGKIIKGSTAVDKSMLTGESRPVRKSRGSSVIGSSVNLENNVLVETGATGENTVLHDIIKLIENALTSKSSVEKTVDRIARAFIPVIISVATITMIVMGYLGYSFNEIIIRAVTIIVISCPCAFGIATPLAVAIALGNCAKKGIIVRESTAFEIVKNIDTFIFDKTGTLTEGKFALLETCTEDSRNATIIEDVAAIESLSNHPIASAITEALPQTLTEVKGFKAVKSLGVKGTVNGKTIFIGNSIFTENAGFMILGDKLKESAAITVRNLSDKNNADIWLVSGDSETTTKIFAEKAGIKNFKGRALPQDKIHLIKDLQNKGKTVCMIGDGINDAPALAQSDVGIAIGSGTDIAHETSDVIMMRDDLNMITSLIDISKKNAQKDKTESFLGIFL